MGKTTATVSQQIYHSLLQFLSATYPVTQDKHPVMISGWVIVLGIVLFVLSPILYVLILRLLNKYQSVYLYEIRFPKVDDTQLAIYEIGSVFSSLHNLLYSPFLPMYKVFFEVVKTSGYIKVYLGSNDPRILEEVKKTISHIKNIEFKEEKNDPLASFAHLFAKKISSTKSFYPLNYDPLFFDHVLSDLNMLSDDEFGGFQFIIQGVNKSYNINNAVHKAIARDIRHYGKETSEGRNEVELFRQKDRGNLFKVKIHVFSNKKAILPNFVSTIISLGTFKNKFFARDEGKTDIKNRYIAPETFISNINYVREYEGIYATSEELGYLIHPTTLLLSKWNPQQENSLEADRAFYVEEGNKILIGTKTDKDGVIQKIFLLLDNLKYHIHVLGKTGKGKTSFIFTLINAIRKVKGATTWVIDPHGDLLKDLLQSMPLDKNTVYLNIENQSSIFGFNPIYARGKSEQQKSAIIDTILDIIQNETEEKTGQSVTGNTTYIRMKQMLTLAVEFGDAYYCWLTTVQKIEPIQAEKLARDRQITLNDIPFFLHKKMGYYTLFTEVFRDYPSLTTPSIMKMFEDYTNQTAVIEAVQVRFDQLLHRSTMLIYEGHTLNLEKAVEDGKMYLIPIPNTVYGSRGARGLLQILFSLLWIYKEDKGQKERKPTYLFIDEFQNAQLATIPTILSEARKYKLYLITAHQYIAQLKDTIREAIFGTVGTLVAFQSGADKNGALDIAKNLGGGLTEKDIVSLPKYTAYLKTDGMDDNPNSLFSFNTIEVEESSAPQKLIDKINAESLGKYGEEIRVIKERLARKQNDPSNYFMENLENN